jgi:hypothetical protein
MKSAHLILIPLLFLSVHSYSQLTEAQYEDSKRFRHKYARTIDQQDTLLNNCLLTLSHSTELECIHMTDTSGTIHMVWIRPRDYPGWVVFHADFEDYVTFEYRGDGSGNSCTYFSISKFDGSPLK